MKNFCKLIEEFVRLLKNFSRLIGNISIPIQIFYLSFIQNFNFNILPVKRYHITT